MADPVLSTLAVELLPEATRRLIRTTDALPDGEYAAPSGCAGWTRGHVVAHLALNAEGLAAALQGIVEGRRVPMYVSQEDRDGDIEELAEAKPSILRARLLGACSDFAEAYAAVPPDQLTTTIDRIPGGATFVAGEVPIMRLREVEIHHADLATDYTRSDWPDAFAELLVETMAARDPRPVVTLHAVDLDRTWTLGEGGPTVSGPAADLGWWLTGRGDGAGLTSDGGTLPPIGSWVMTTPADDYVGHVTPGGAPEVRELEHLTITKIAVDPQMSNNCYLLRCRHTGDQVLIDAAAEPDTLLPLIGEAGLTTVVTTHQHWDHHRALADVVSATGAEVVVGAPDAAAVTEQTGVPVTRTVSQGDTIAVGDCTLEVIALAGHTPGSIALLYDDSGSAGGHPHLFTGDSLFPGGVGNTFGDDAAFAQLIDEVEAKVFQRLPDDAWFYPGHGDDSTIGAERPSLGEWRERGW